MKIIIATVDIFKGSNTLMCFDKDTEITETRVSTGFWIWHN